MSEVDRVRAGRADERAGARGEEIGAHAARAGQGEIEARCANAHADIGEGIELGSRQRDEVAAQVLDAGDRARAEIADARQGIVVGSAVQNGRGSVVEADLQRIVAASAAQGVEGTSVEVVVAVAPVEQVGTFGIGDAVVASSAVQTVVSKAATEAVGACSTVENVVAGASNEGATAITNALTIEIQITALTIKIRR